MIPVSMLSAYLYCPRKVFLQQVLKLQEPTRESSLKGTLKHHCLQAFNARERQLILAITAENEYKDVEKSYETVFSLELKNAIILNKRQTERLGFEPSNVFNSLWPALKLEYESRAKTIWDFCQKHKIYGQELWENLTPKIKSEYKVDSELLGLSGVIDQVHVYNDILVPVDLKTGKAPKEGIWPSHRIQISAYMMLLEEKFDFNVNMGMVYYLDAGYREVRMNPFLRNDVIKIRDIVEALLSGKDLPSILKNETKCAKCGFFRPCRDQAVIQQRLYP